jgi:transposase-like protein/IS1 family transposase
VKLRHFAYKEWLLDPQPAFCPNLACPSRGKIGAGNLRVHDSLRNRWRCRVCNKTFSGRRGTPFYALKTDEKTVILVVTLLSFGCPLQAIVAAFELDERTVATWHQRAGQHCQQVHEALVETPQNLRHVQADEIRVRCQKRLVVWLAMAICVPTRLWLGGVVSPNRDKSLGRAIAKKVKACCGWGALLVVTDGWSAYREAFVQAFRWAIRIGQRGRPALLSWPDFALAQTLKWQQAGRTVGIRVCHLFGNWQQIACLLPAGQVLSTAYIERFNATMRQRLAGLCRRTRSLLRYQTTVSTGMYLVGTVYNFCTPHRSLTKDKQERTPAMAAGLTRHLWSVGELLGYQIAPPPYVAPKRRGRKPKNVGLETQKGATQLVTV